MKIESNEKRKSIAKIKITINVNVFKQTNFICIPVCIASIVQILHFVHAI